MHVDLENYFRYTDNGTSTSLHLKSNDNLNQSSVDNNKNVPKPTTEQDPQNPHATHPRITSFAPLFNQRNTEANINLKLNEKKAYNFNDVVLQDLNLDNHLAKYKIIYINGFENINFDKTYNELNTLTKYN